MPLLRAAYGLSRAEALELPHWEFQQLVVAFSQQKARDTLSLYQAVGMAFGGKPRDTAKYVETLRKASGQMDNKPTEVKKPRKMSESFGGMPGIPTAEDYQAIVAERANQNQ